MDREGNALMIARGFKSVIWVACVGSAALSCYMVSLRVATERNDLAKVERQIVDARRDIRSLQTELGTRGRMTQLEQWNSEVLALSAPSSAQFLKDEYTLARLDRHEPTVDERTAQVRLASAEVPAAPPAEAAKPAPRVVQAVAEPAPAPAPLLRQASFTPPETATASKPKKPAATSTTTAAKPAKPAATPPVIAAKPTKPAAQRIASATPAKPEPAATAAKPGAKPAPARAKTLRETVTAARDPKPKAGAGTD
jgi:hypothetical protein